MSRAALFFENTAHGQQLAVRQHSAGRLRLRTSDRFFWVLLSRFWSRWRSVPVIAQPRTVIAWHREGWRLFWRCKSRGGQPTIDREHRALIHRLSAGRYSPKSAGHSASERAHSQTWRAFPKNHVREICACDFLVQWTGRVRVRRDGTRLAAHRSRQHDRESDARLGQAAAAGPVRFRLGAALLGSRHDAIFGRDGAKARGSRKEP
jgi:hypothetical protein